MALRIREAELQPETADAVIWREGDYVVAKMRGRRGEISSWYICEILSHMFSLFPETQTIRVYVHPGIYYFKQTVRGRKNVVIESSGKGWGFSWGEGGAVFRPTSNIEALFDFVDKSTMIEFRYIIFDCRKRDGFTTKAVKLGLSTTPGQNHHVVFEDCTFYDCDIGIYCDPNLAVGFVDSRIVGCLFQKCRVGVDLGFASTQVQFEHCSFGDNDIHIVVRDYCNPLFINTVFSTGRIAVAIEADRRVGSITFVKCWFEHIEQSWVRRTKTPSISKVVESIDFINCNLNVSAEHDETYPILDLTDIITTVHFIGGAVSIASGKTFTIANPEGSLVIFDGFYGAEYVQFTGVERYIMKRWNGEVTMKGIPMRIDNDIEFTNATRGIILVDRTTGTKYRLYVDNGTLNIEPVS